MTQAQISSFLEVAKYRSFSKAAAHMFVSQPAVSKQVAALEADLGLALIERTPAGVGLTEAGRLFYDFFLRFSNELDAVWDEAKRLAGNREETIRLGCLDGWDISAFYPELRGILREKYPEVRVGLRGYNHINVIDALRRGEIDVAISLELALQRQRDLTVRNITSAPVVLLFSASHPLARKEDVSLADFRNEPFFVVAPDPGTDNPTEQLTIDVCREAGFTPQIEHTPSSASVLLCLQGGAGAQVTCAWTGACKLPTYRMVVLDRMLNISAAWPGREHKRIRDIFVEELCKHYDSEEKENA